MKNLICIMALVLMLAPVTPGHAFFDYLFGGSHTRDSIDNSAVGDLRAWWTGNPGYQFNPYWSGGTNPAQQQQGASPSAGEPQGYSQMGYGQGADQPQPQASVHYFPGQGQQFGGGYDQSGQAMQYQQQPQYYQQQPQYYQQPAPQYQASPQQYQYQQVPQMSPQQAPQYYPQQYQGAPQAAQYPGGYGR